MAATVRLFLSLEALVFGLAALMHTGRLVSGYEHREAAIAESVIGIVLFAGLLVSLMAPTSSRRAGVLSQGFALLGTFVGLFTIAIGIGPRTALDLAIHAVMIALLAGGLLAVTRPHAARVT
jgi:hypothetical protein